MYGLTSLSWSVHRSFIRFTAALEKRTIHLLICEKPTQELSPPYAQLSDQAINFLKVLRLTSDKYLFPSQATKKPIQQKYLTENSWPLRESGQMPDIPHWTPHDLRHTLIHMAVLKGFIICINMKQSVIIGCRFGRIIL